MKKQQLHPIDIVYNTLQMIGGILIIIGTIANFMMSLCILALVKLFYKLVYSRPFHILWGFDAIMQYQGSTVFTPEECASLIQFVIQLKGSPDIGKVRKRFQTNILQINPSDPCTKYYSVYTKRIVRKFGYYIWEDDSNFAIEEHIRLSSLSYEDDRSLTKVANDLYHQPLPKGHSPWEVLVIPKKSFNSITNQELNNEKVNEYSLVVRLHHSIADGTLLVLTCASMSDDACKHKFNELRKMYSANPEKLSPIIKHNPIVNYLVKRQNGGKLTFQIMLAMLTNLLEGCISVPRLLAENVFHSERNALHGPKLNGRKIFGLSEKIDVHILKDIAKARNCSINDILTYCVVNAFVQEDPKATSVRIYTAVGGFMPGAVGTQNSYTFFGFDIPLQDDNYVDRLKRISEILTSFKSSPFLLAQIGIITMSANHMPMFLAKSRFHNYDTTIDITNLVGPPLEISINGDVVTDVAIYSMNFGKTGGVTFSCFSYINKLRIGLVIDRAVAPDDLIADRMVTNVVKELYLLHKSI